MCNCNLQVDVFLFIAHGLPRYTNDFSNIVVYKRFVLYKKGNDI